MTPHGSAGPTMVAPTAAAPMTIVPVPANYTGSLNTHNSNRAKHVSTPPMVRSAVGAGCYMRLSLGSSAGFVLNPEGAGLGFGFTGLSVHRA